MNWEWIMTHGIETAIFISVAVLVICGIVWLANQPPSDFPGGDGA